MIEEARAELLSKVIENKMECSQVFNVGPGRSSWPTSPGYPGGYRLIVAWVPVAWPGRLSIGTFLARVPMTFIGWRTGRTAISLPPERISSVCYFKGKAGGVGQDENPIHNGPKKSRWAANGGGVEGGGFSQCGDIMAHSSIS